MNKIFIITKDFDDIRVDRWIKKNIITIPQSLIEKSLRNGSIKVNNHKVKSSYKLKFNDKVYLYNFNHKEKLPKKKNLYQIKKK
tara:strand:+ start:604 stop:855 length:252 start_codon:yes stop_codon:yes gene_type:complete